MDVKYIPSDWEKTRKGIDDHILGIGFGKGMIDHLKDLNEILEDAESDIAKYDSDGVISYQHTSQKGKYEELEKDFDILHSFSGKVGEIVDRTIDEPFYQDIDAFVEAIRNIDPMKYATKNRITLFVFQLHLFAKEIVSWTIYMRTLKNKKKYYQ